MRVTLMKASFSPFVAIVLLLFSFSSYAQNTLDKAGATVSYPPGAAYSLRLLSSTYTGYSVRVRRADNATQDIGFTPNGDFDTMTLKAFAGNSNAFVAIWYDQSGYGRDAVQSSSSNQPQIVSSGTIYTNNGLPAISFNGSSQYLQTSSTATWLNNAPYSISAIAQTSGKSNNYLVGTNISGLTDAGLHFGERSATQFTLAQYGDDADYTITQTTNLTILTAIKTTSGSACALNGTSLSGATNLPSSYLNTTGALNIGAGYNTSENWLGNVSEIIIFTSDISSIKTSLEINQSSYYGITLNGLANNQWIGTSSNSWATATNWSNGVLPTSSDNVTISSASTKQPVLSASTAVNNLILYGTLGINSDTLTINGTVSGTGFLTGSATSSVLIGGSGALGTLYFNQTTVGTTNLLNNLIIHRTGSGTVTLGNSLNIKGIITPTMGQLITNGNLTLVSTDIYGAGAIANASSNTDFPTNYISGTVNVQRYTQAQRGYRTLAHPYQDAQPLTQLTDNFQITGLSLDHSGTYGVATGNPSAFIYDPTAVAPSNPLTKLYSATALYWGRGKGLYVFIRGNGNEGSGGVYTNGIISPVTIDVKNGVVNQGTVDVNVDYLAGANNYNLIGNPYPCSINLRNVLMSDGSSLISRYGTIYLYSPDLQISSSKVSAGAFIPLSTSVPFSITVPPMGAFYVQADSNRTIRFQESAKMVTNSIYALFGETKIPSIKLSINTNNMFMDEVLVGFDKTSTSNGNDFYDANKLVNSVLDFYTIATDKKILAIDYRSDTFTDSIIPLGIRTNALNPYTISLSELTDMPNMQLILRDKLLQKEILLTNIGDGYSFDITSDTITKGDNRFELVMRANSTTVLPVDLSNFSAQLQANNQVVVRWLSSTEVNLASYQVQRSMDGINFSTVATVAPKGASNYQVSEDISNTNLPNTVYYRLETIDKDGSKSYSSIAAVAFANNAKMRLNIYSNPVTATLKAQVTTLKAGAATITVTDVQGKILVKQTSQLALGTSQVAVDISNFASGNYLLRISGTDFHLQQAFVKE
jgi:hypothetical protein